MLRLLRTFRKGDVMVKVGDIEPILEVLNLNRLFSTKPPRENVTVDPGFLVYRGVAGVNVPATFGELHQTDVVPATWTGGSVTLGGHDFLQQQDGFRPSSVPEGNFTMFPRLWVQIKCSSWSHREKRSSKSNAAGLGPIRHGSLGPIPDVGPGGPAWDASCSLMQAVNEEARPEKGLATLKTMQSQDDWEVGRRNAASRSGSVVSTFGADNERIDHKVVLAVISGHARHGIRIGQHERSSIYSIEDLYGQGEEVCLGGSPTEVEFELQLTARAPSKCGICSCTLAVLPPGTREYPPNPLLEVAFDASAEEHLHFYISSSHFDSNSTYGVALNWVLRPGSGGSGAVAASAARRC
ncbi:unnamed protein product [Prorocentrum cordatum]|uniref:Uncharacterized protein n=2 Tax=Prorocentrum cordatum TaxID=2364126 RepID=A0ABN9UAE2_9DINO|nr:unnamed protein product [Polarella glacialis]